MSDDAIISMAVLAKGRHPRRLELWQEYFGYARVAVKPEPVVVVLPLIGPMMCWLVDFGVKPVDGPSCFDRVAAAVTRMAPHERNGFARYFAGTGEYPLACEGVVVVRASLAWLNRWDEMQPPSKGGE